MTLEPLAKRMHENHDVHPNMSTSIQLDVFKSIQEMQVRHAF